MGLMKVMVVIHRYLGVVVGLVMTLWCLSGFVMMYQAYPETTGQEQLAGLQPLDLADCCQAEVLPFSDAEAFSGFRIEMMAGTPVLRASRADGPAVIYNLRTGAEVTGVDVSSAGRIAGEWAVQRGLSAQPAITSLVRDQWSVQLAGRHQPIYRAHFGDPAGSEVYVSGRTGEVIQDTTTRERILGWLGAVPHWLYPTVLRQHSGAWVQVVIWASVIGTFLTVTGVYVGVSRWVTAPKGRVSPFRGLWMWHHMIGLVFGVLTLTWVFSGLLTMNPWGWLESDGRASVAGYAGEMSGGDIKSYLAGVSASANGPAVRLEAIPIGGRLFVRSITADGENVRTDANGRAAPLQRQEVEAALSTLPVAVGDLELMEREDAYYYGHHSDVALPVWRATLADEEATRVYIDAQSGQIARVVDATSRLSRWTRVAFHDLDLPGLRAKPLWHLITSLLLAGVTAVCATGLWLAWRRVKLDILRLRMSGGKTKKRTT